MDELWIGIVGRLPCKRLTKEGSIFYVPSLVLVSFSCWRMLPFLRIFSFAPHSHFFLLFLVGFFPMGPLLLCRCWDHFSMVLCLEPFPLCFTSLGIYSPLFFFTVDLWRWPYLVYLIAMLVLGCRKPCKICFLLFVPLVGLIVA